MDYFSSLARNGIDLVQGNVYSLGYFFKKRTGACRTLPVHFEVFPTARGIDVNNLVILASYIDDRGSAREEMKYGF